MGEEKGPRARGDVPFKACDACEAIREEAEYRIYQRLANRHGMLAWSHRRILDRVRIDYAKGLRQ